MKILMGHNFYRSWGGEDAVYKNESSLLEKHGHEIIHYERNNKEIDNLNLFNKVRVLTSIGWSNKSYKDIKNLIKEYKPQIAHFHNISYLMTPSVYAACKELKVPVVQSLHNFRLLCANGLLFRNGQACELCFKKRFRYAVFNKCFQDSYLLTCIFSRVLKKQWSSGFLVKNINAFIALSEFSKRKFIEEGLPENRVFVKPNFFEYSDNIETKKDDYAIYIGRLNEEKGLNVLIDAWKEIRDMPLKIIGEGPLENILKKFIQHNNMNNIEFLGKIKRERLEFLLRKARIMIFPSICYENFPMVILEAFSFGTPVIASNFGSIPEIIKHNKTGILFDAGNSDSLKEAIFNVWENYKLQSAISKAAKKLVENEYSPDNNYNKLIDIYSNLINFKSDY